MPTRSIAGYTIIRTDTVPFEVTLTEGLTLEFALRVTTPGTVTLGAWTDPDYDTLDEEADYDVDSSEFDWAEESLRLLPPLVIDIHETDTDRYRQWVTRILENESFGSIEVVSGPDYDTEWDDDE
jgi:hypothetical protein